MLGLRLATVLAVTAVATVTVLALLALLTMTAVALLALVELPLRARCVSLALGSRRSARGRGRSAGSEVVEREPEASTATALEPAAAALGAAGAAHGRSAGIDRAGRLGGRRRSGDLARVEREGGAVVLGVAIVEGGLGRCR